jgi:AraC family transcriptional regulator
VDRLRKEDMSVSEVSIKFFMPMKVASMEKKAPREEVGKIVAQLSKSLQEKKVKVLGAPMGLLHDDIKSIDPQKAHYEVCIPISGKVKGEGEVKGKELEKGAFACITHSGPAEKLPEAYSEILKWVGENGYRISGSTREVYHKGAGETGGSPQDVIIEIQFPIRK